MTIQEPTLTTTAQKIIKKRYLRTDMSGNTLETPGEMFARVAKHFAKAEINWGNADDVEKNENEFYGLMVDLKLIPGGKSLFEAGNPGGTGQLSSCFVLPIKDDMKQIFKTLGDAALVHKNNGGTGFNFSAIRPRGDKVKNVPGAASGPVDFLGAFSAALSKILQGSKRQGANIGILNCDHPDIIDFITMKDEDGTIKNFNISVGVTNKFLEAVQQDKIWELKNPRNGEVTKRISARKLFDMIAKHAWATGDPGLAFLDRMEVDNPTPQLGKLDATNPCGEIALLPYESCNLASIVLSNHVIIREGETSTSHLQSDYSIDWKSLEHTIKTGIRLLDNMIEVNTYALPEIEAMVKNGNRRIGLGVMGFAHLLYKLNIPYNSEEAVRLAERLAKFIRRKSEETSLLLGKERGVFPNWDRSIFAGTAETYRNCALNMIAPTGTISMVANCSSGIEPVFSLVTKRRTFFEDDKNNRPTQELFMTDPIFEQYIETKLKTLFHKEGSQAKHGREIYDDDTSQKDKEKIKNLKSKILTKVSETNSLDEIDILTQEEKKIFTTSHGISPEWHIRIQSAWQKYFDNSVSKTINFPNSATIDQVKDSYIMAWKQGCKGITIYRDGSKHDQVLSTASSLKKIKKQPKSNPSITKLDKQFTQNRRGEAVGGFKEDKDTTFPDKQIIPHVIQIESKKQNKLKTQNTKVKTNQCPDCGADLNKAKICYTCGWTQSKILI